MFQILLWISFSFALYEFNFVASWNKRKSIITLRSSFQISQLEKLVSYSRSTVFNVNVSFQNSNFEGNVSTYVFGKLFLHYRQLKTDCWTWRHILCEKILNIFLSVEVRIVVEKWNIYEAHIFPRPLLQTCRLEATTLFLNTRLRVNKKFPISLYFYWN